MKIPCFSKVSLVLGAMLILASMFLFHPFLLATIGLLLFVLAALDILECNWIDTEEEDVDD